MVSDAVVTGDVIPNPAGTLPYKVVFRLNGAMLSEWPIISIAEGEAQIAAALRSVGDGEDNKPAGLKS